MSFFKLQRRAKIIIFCKLVSLFIFYFIIIFMFYVAFDSQGHIAAGNLWVEEPVHTS